MTDYDERFGQALHLALGDGPSPTTVAAQRRRLLASLERTEPRLRGELTPLRIAALALAAGLALALVLGLRGSLRRGEMYATWSGRSVQGPSAFEAAAAHPESVDFSEGSQLLLEPDTRARLLELSATKAALVLEDGHILASIRKHTGVTWTIAAGPYNVRVVGTRFTLDWDREKRALRVAVREGRVRVSGGDLAGDGLVLDAGSLFERQHGSIAVSLPQAATVPGETSPMPAPAAPRPAASNSASGTGANAPAVATPTAAPEPGWEALASQRKYREALASAEKAGFDKLVDELSEDGLLLLANTARYSGNTGRARQAQLKLRERFAGRRSAALAAFYLAREALDVEPHGAAAVRWFETFLEESPRGDLAALARANLMSILLGRGENAKARKMAADYLRYHPDGAQAKEARSVLESPASAR
jgi:hypothetical protein